METGHVAEPRPGRRHGPEFVSRADSIRPVYPRGTILEVINRPTSLLLPLQTGISRASQRPAASMHGDARPPKAAGRYWRRQPCKVACSPEPQVFEGHPDDPGPCGQGGGSGPWCCHSPRGPSGYTLEHSPKMVSMTPTPVAPGASEGWIGFVSPEAFKPGKVLEGKERMFQGEVRDLGKAGVGRGPRE